MVGTAPNVFAVIKLTVGQLQSNCFILYNTRNRDAIIIDPGDDGEYISDKLQTFELVPRAILLTHGHFDHLQAALTLQLAYNIPCYLNKKDYFFLKDMRSTALHYTKVDPGPPPQVLPLADSGICNILDFTIKIMPVPGHTPGSLAFYIPGADCVFVGDLVFSDGTTGEWRHKYGDRKVLHKSINTLLQLPEQTIVYTGHGEDSSILELMTYFGD